MQDKHNHHYVSQVLSRKFMDNNTIYRCNKSTSYIRELKSTKKLFSKLDLNSVIEKDGSINHNLIENDLNQYFENHFPKHYKVLIEAIYSGNEVGQLLPNPLEIDEAVEYIIGMALIGHARHPQRMQQKHDFILEAFKTISNLAIPELKNGINDYIDKVASVKNKLPVDFQNIKNRIRHYMGEVRFGVMRAPENHYFILPDCTSAIKRFPIAPDVIDGKTYYNPAMVIGLTLMPINSKVLIAASSRDILSGGFEYEQSGFHDIDEATTMNYNRILFESAYDEVACESKEYLEKFLNDIKS